MFADFLPSCSCIYPYLKFAHMLSYRAFQCVYSSVSNAIIDRPKQLKNKYMACSLIVHVHLPLAFY
jgi:uncharacterized membrane protein